MNMNRTGTQGGKGDIGGMIIKLGWFCDHYNDLIL